MLKRTAPFVPAADEVYRMQNPRTGTDPECRLFQKFADQGHYRQPGATRQGTYCVTPSGVLLGSLNSNDPKRVADLLERAAAKWGTMTREERLLPNDPEKQRADIKRPERFYPKDGLVLTVTARDGPRDGAPPPRAAWQAHAWNLDFAWFTRSEADQFLPAKPTVGEKCDLPRPIVHRLACAHLVDNVRGQTAPFDESQVKKARLSAAVTAVAGDVVTLRLDGETRTERETPRLHGLDVRLLGKATYDRVKGRFLTFDLIAVGARWGGTPLNGRRGDGDGTIGILFALADGGSCQKVAPAFSAHPVYRPVVGAQ